MRTLLSESIGRQMRNLAALLILSAILVACDKHDEVVSTGKRPQTMRENYLQVGMTPEESYKQGRANMMEMAEPAGMPEFAAKVPAGWDPAEKSQFRQLNYTFGTEGEVYLTVLSGGLFENVNRWLKQFDKPALTPEEIGDLEKMSIVGQDGVWVSADGDFMGGMGKEPKKDWALRGVVSEGPHGIVTMKMIGPAEEVAAEEENLRQYIASLRIINE